MKKLLIFLVLVVFFCFNCLLVTYGQAPPSETITITTYYPAPFGVYRTLRLFPGERPAEACQGGELYYDNGEGSEPQGLYYCDGTDWQSLGFWTLSPVTNNDIYPNDTNWNVGIGLVNPNARLQVNGAISRQGTTLTGTNANTHINLGVNSKTGLSDRPYCTVGGGYKNEALGEFSTVSGGQNNHTWGEKGGTVSGGEDNYASAYATVSGGIDNGAQGWWSTASGGKSNEAHSAYTVVSGGWKNLAWGGYSTVSGGESNSAGERGIEADGWYSTVSGGRDNLAKGYGSTISGGGWNNTNDYWSTVSGGRYNEATGFLSTVSGGSSNKAKASYSVVSGGSSGWAEGTHSTVSGGSGGKAYGDYSTVSGGYLNTASGQYSWAAGRGARAEHDGSFVWADSQDANYSSNGDNTFNIRAAGGVWMQGKGRVSDDWDIAEFMDVLKSENVKEAELVSLIDNGLLGKSKKPYDDNLIGVISSKRTTTLHLGDTEKDSGLKRKLKRNIRRLPVSLVGRCYIKVTGEGGTIKVGDPITSSSRAGVGMKATQSGKIVGYSMENKNFRNKDIKEILVFVNVGYYVSKEDVESLKKVKQLEEDIKLLKSSLQLSYKRRVK